MQVSIVWDKEMAKWTSFALLALIGFALTMGGGLAVFQLFGANPLFILVFLVGGTFGYTLATAAPLPVLRILGSILLSLGRVDDLLEALLTLPLSISSDAPILSQERGEAVEDGGEPLPVDSELVALLQPQPFPLSETFDGYVVRISGTTPHYLERLGDKELFFTSDYNNACLFKNRRDSFTFAQLCFIVNGDKNAVEVRGVPIKLGQGIIS